MLFYIVEDRQKNMKRSVGEHDQFYKELSGSCQQGDAFATVAEYYGRGVVL